MIIRKKRNGKIMKIDVSDVNCTEYACFSPHYYTHKSKSIDGKSQDWQNQKLSCSHRDFHGCPEHPKRRDR